MNHSVVSLTVLAPVRDEGPSLGDHVRACLRAVPGLDLELVVLDNQSIDGCCHNLPREVLVVRTERVESPVGLWRLGRSLAKGGGLLWLPGLLFVTPDEFRELARTATELAARMDRALTDRRGPLMRFPVVRERCCFLTQRSRARLDRLSRIPLIGRILFGFGARLFRSVIPVRAKVRGKAQSPVPEPAREEPTSPAPFTIRRGVIRLSVIITAHNEGEEVLRTVHSVLANTRLDHEIIVVDDGSDDGSCTGWEVKGVRVIRHDRRVGVAYSRDAGSRAAEGDAFAYLDAHQRVDPGGLDRCAEVAVSHGAITCSPCRPLNRRYPVGYGASFQLCPERGFFSARPRILRPAAEISRVSGLRAPGYVIPRSVYDRVAWIAGLRGWGATDYGVALKAFFTDVDVLLVHSGATEHLFRKQIPYATTWDGVWRNQALIARVCFDDRTWEQYWLPEVFQGHLTDETLREMDAPSVRAEHDSFQSRKSRSDREFWRGLLLRPEPRALRIPRDAIG